MNVLVLGSGGREHALAWKISQSELCGNLFVAPGNGGTGKIAENISVSADDFPAISNIIQDKTIELLVIGPEGPLVNGLVDYLKTSHPDLLVIGPDRKGAKLEGSKEFAKLFMNKYGIPTAGAKVFNKQNIDEGKEFLEGIHPPYVLKADGLAAGKGVIITSDIEEAKQNLESLIDGRFGPASANVLIEEYLDGIEISVFVLTDGSSYCILPEAKDYKRIGENDSGPNTGGMGAVSPVIFADTAFMQKIEDRIIKPTIQGIKSENFDYKGFIFFGLINVKGDPYVIEYNVRLGDPETQAVLPRIQSDFLSTLISTAKSKLETTDISISKKTATTVVLVSDGYPGKYDKGKQISIKEESADAIVFHAGTIMNEGKLKTNGGRVIAVTGMGDSIDEALEASYENVGKIEWEGKKFRKDIGQDLKKLGQ